MRDPDTEEEELRTKEKRDVILVDQDFKYSHLYTIPFEQDAGGERALLERSVQRLTGGDFHVTSFDWLPDGSSLVFAHASDPRINSLGFGQDLSTVPADSGGGFVAETEPDSRQPGRFWESVPPAGFERRGRYVVIPPQQENFTDPTRRGNRLTYLSDVFVDGASVVVLDPRGLPLAITPGGTTVGVAEHAVLLMLAFAMITQRRILSLIHLFTLQGATLVLSTALGQPGEAPVGDLFDVAQPAARVGGHPQVLADGEVGVELTLLEHQADPLPDRLDIAAQTLLLRRRMKPVRCVVSGLLRQGEGGCRPPILTATPVAGDVLGEVGLHR